VRLPEALAAEGIGNIELMKSNDASLVHEIRWAEEKKAEGTHLHIMIFSRNAATDHGLGSEKDQSFSFGIVPYRGSGDHFHVGSSQTGSDSGLAEVALNALWGYEWKDWKFRDILSFIEEHLEGVNRRETSGIIKFEFDESAKEFGSKIVTLKIDSEPLRTGLDRLCKQLGLTYEVDRTRNTLRFSKK
jgi:hypothetical protein